MYCIVAIQPFGCNTTINFIQLLIFDETGEIRDLRQNCWRNLHFLTNEKWHFWRQNLVELSRKHQVISLTMSHSRI